MPTVHELWMHPAGVEAQMEAHRQHKGRVVFQIRQAPQNREGCPVINKTKNQLLWQKTRYSSTNTHHQHTPLTHMNTNPYLSPYPCSLFHEDPCVCDDVGEPKGQCIHCGYKESEHQPKRRKYRTHAGNAHQDEFLAACLLVAMEHTVLRSNAPVEGAIDFDVGGGPLDHHQLPNGGEGKCALHLVADHLGIALYGEWAEVVGIIDCGKQEQRLPLRPAAWAGNPIIRWALDQFAAVSVVGGDLERMMSSIGRSIIRAHQEVQDALDDVLARPRIAVGMPDGTCVQALDLRGVKSHEATQAIKKLEPDTFVVLTGRDPGSVNLLAPRDVVLKREDYPNATFVHAAGFMAVFADINDL